MNARHVRNALSGLLVALAASAFAQEAEVSYPLGPQDVVAIQLFDEPDLGGKFTIEADGSFTFPLIGRVAATGLSVSGLEERLRTKLADGFFRNPQVSVGVAQYHSQRVFIVGEVRSPGTYPLAGEMSLIEALARAGSTTDAAAGEAVIVRSGSGRAGGPTFPDDRDVAGVIRIDIKALQGGQLSQNVRLRDGDTIFVPRAELVFVFGQVKNPGAYPIRKGMTVLQALSLAGGLTDRGASGRIRIVRQVNEKRSEIGARLDDLVAPGDTITVRERFF